jgi:hypothetical protein
LRSGREPSSYIRLCSRLQSGYQRAVNMHRPKSPQSPLQAPSKAS